MTSDTDLMSIGVFSSLSRLSVRMLRHYDAHGVLVPADVDPFTGHRRYAVHQLRDAADIRNLRDVGLGVAAISALLPVRGTPAWARALVQQRGVLAGELAQTQQRLHLIDRLLDPEGSTMTITIEHTTVPAMTIVSLRGTVPTYADEPQLWARMSPELARQGIEPIGPCGVIEHDDEFTEHDVDLSIFLPVSDDTSVEAPLELHHLPARSCVVAHVRGPYDQLTRAHDLINDHLATHGLSPACGDDPAGKAFNIYLNTPDTTRPDDLLTDVHEPLA